MVTRASMLAFWLLRRAAGRWPAGIRAELLREWTAEVQTIARDRSLRAPRRCWLLLAFGTSLALARPGGDPAYAPLGWKRIAGVVGAVSAYLMILALLQRGWSSVFGYMAAAKPTCARTASTTWRCGGRRGYVATRFPSAAAGGSACPPMPECARSIQ
jgi:hypothetical protein